MLHELGLETAIEHWLIEQIQKKYKINCELINDVQPLQLDLDEETSIILFQAVRELLINVIKHAKAKKVEVSIQQVDDEVRLSIEDDGIGFSTAKLHPSMLNKKTGGFGIFGIRERLEYLGGGLEIKSAPGEGTCVVLTAPTKAGKITV